MLGDVHKLERSIEYQKIKQRCQDEWREKIFKRDNYKCRICENSAHLHLAHLTTVRAFLWANSKSNLTLEEKIKLAYSDDNLITLCSNCHRSFHGSIKSLISIELKKVLDQKEEMKKIPQIQEWLKLNKKINEFFNEANEEAYQRKNKVDNLFYEIKKKRGWTSAKQKLINKKCDYAIQYNNNRLKIIEKNNNRIKNIENIQKEIEEMDGIFEEHTYWTGSAISIGTKNNQPASIRMYSAWEIKNENHYNNNIFPHGTKFLLSKPLTWDNPIIKELWNEYKKYRNAKEKEINDRLKKFE